MRLAKYLEFLHSHFSLFLRMTHDDFERFQFLLAVVWRKSDFLIGHQDRDRHKDKDSWAIGGDANKNSNIQEMTTENFPESRPKPTSTTYFAVRFLQKQKRKKFPWHALATLSRSKHFSRAGGGVCLGRGKAKGARFLHVVNFSFFFCMFGPKIGAWRGRKDMAMPQGAG